MNLSSKYLIKVLEESEFVFKRSKGSDQIFYNAVKNETDVVPTHGNKDLKKGIFLAILKEAGISKDVV